MTDKTTSALKLAEKTLRDIIRVYKFETGTPVTALAAIREALAEQEKQEPVEYHVENVYERGDKYFAWIGDGYVQIFTAQVSAKREWVDLTCEEVTALIREGAADGGWQGFAERVQAAYKEKNT